MKLFPRCSGPLAIVTALWALSGCNDSGPIIPRTLTVTGGDRQTGCIPHSLPDCLEVTLTGSDDKPFAGAPVQWAPLCLTESLNLG